MSRSPNNQQQAPGWSSFLDVPMECEAPDHSGSNIPARPANFQNLNSYGNHLLQDLDPLANNPQIPTPFNPQANTTRPPPTPPQSLERLVLSQLFASFNPPNPSPPPPTPALSETIDTLAWLPAYQQCQTYFVNKAQYSGIVQSVASFINIRLPNQQYPPVNSLTITPTNQSQMNPSPLQTSPQPVPSHSPTVSPAAFTNPPHPRDQHPHAPAPEAFRPPPFRAIPFVSLIPYIRRLVVTGFDQEAVLHGFFGNEWQAGVGKLHEMERKNFMFAAKSHGWTGVKALYDVLPDQTVPFIQPLQRVDVEEIQGAENSWSDWLAMEDWMLGPRAPHLDESMSENDEMNPVDEIVQEREDDLERQRQFRHEHPEEYRRHHEQQLHIILHQQELERQLSREYEKERQQSHKNDQKNQHQQPSKQNSSQQQEKQQQQQQQQHQSQQHQSQQHQSQQYQSQQTEQQQQPNSHQAEGEDAIIITVEHESSK